MASSILIVDDEQELTKLYKLWIEDTYSVQTANSGHEALNKLSADIDIVLLDRRMPDISGKEVLQTIRDTEGNCSVAMITGVPPTEDVIDMGFDEYLVKPISKEDLSAVIADLERRQEYDEQIQRLYSLASKRVALLEKGNRSKEVTNAIEEIETEINELQRDIETTINTFNNVDIQVTFRDIPVTNK
ncbi:MAG: response regulator transcription factor [Halobacteriaceae archaeon]